MTNEQVRDVRDLTRAAGIKPTTTRIAGNRHPILTELAPGERALPGGLEPAPTTAAPARKPGNGSGGGSNNRRRRPAGSGQAGSGQSRQGSGGNRRRRPANGTASRGPRSAADFSAGRR